MQSKMKLNSEHLFDLATVEINEMPRMQFFSLNSVQIQQYANSKN